MMKSLLSSIFYLFLACLFTGCFNSKDEIWIEADGSGRMESVSDMSSMYPFIAMGMAAEKEKIANGEDVDNNPFMALMMAEEMDTTFAMKDFMIEAMEKEDMTWEQMLDSIRYAPTPEGKEPLTPAEREEVVQLFESMMDLKMRWQVSEKDQIMKSSQIQEFSSINQLKEKAGGMMEMFKKLGEIGGKAGDAEDEKMLNMFDQLSSAVTSLTLSGNTMNIRRTGVDISSSDEEMEQVMSMMSMMMTDNYEIIIHFPGKVKKVNSDMAKVIDKNTVKIEFPLKDIFDPELNIDVDVEFKGLDK